MHPLLRDSDAIPSGSPGVNAPQGPFLCPQCSQRLQASLRSCMGTGHARMPKCPEHSVPMGIPNAGVLAICPKPTGRDARNRRTWRQTRGAIGGYDGGPD